MNKYGFTDKEWKDTLTIFRRCPEIKKIVLFGSRAKNTFKPMSDVDIVLYGEKINQSVIASLQSNFEDSQIPYFFDIIDYKAISSKELKEHIRQYGKPIIGGDNKIPTGDALGLPKGWNKATLGDGGKYDTDFIHYLLKSLFKVLRLYADEGATTPITNKYTFGNQIFDIPPLPEQKAIAAVLSAFDDKIELLREQNQTLEILAQTIFKEWLVHFNFPNKNSTPYRDNGVEIMDSEFGEIPKGKYDIFIVSIFEKIKNNTSQIQTLSKTRDTLLPKLMSGEIRVKGFDQ